MALNIAPVLPSPLSRENPPNRNTHITQVAPWVTYLLRTTIESNVHYESQLHGPIGAFLESIFPQRRQFMNIAQATLREVMDPGDIDDVLSNILFGSTGGERQLRNVPGNETGKLLPDFLTVKVVLSQPNQPRDYRIITVIELKRDDVDLTRASTQMIHYLKRIHQICAPGDSFKGFLILEDKVEVYGYVGFGAARRVEKVDEYSMFRADNPWARDLADIAIQYWNLPVN